MIDRKYDIFHITALWTWNVSLSTYKIFIYNFLCSALWGQLVGKQCPL